jgi:hypothetical protein
VRSPVRRARVRADLVLVASVALSFAGAAMARASDPADPGGPRSEWEVLFPEDYARFQEIARKFDELVERVTSPFRRAPANPAEMPPSSEPADAPGGAPGAAGASPRDDVPIMKSREEQIAIERPYLLRAKGDRVTAMLQLEKRFRHEASTLVDLCKARIAAKDEAEARRICGHAEQVIDECRRRIAPAFDRDAERLTARFGPLFGAEGDFRAQTVYCDTWLRGIDDPARLLRQAWYRLPIDSCHAHLKRLQSFVETGAMTPPAGALGQDDATPDAYGRFIVRMCPPELEAKTRDVLKLAAQRPPGSAAGPAEPSRPAPKWDMSSFPSRMGGDASALLSQSAQQARTDAKDPAAKAERERARAADQRAAEAALDRAGSDYVQQTITGAVGQYQSQQLPSSAIGSDGALQGSPEQMLCTVDPSLCPKTPAECIANFCSLDPRTLAKDAQCVSNCNARPTGRGR